MTPTRYPSGAAAVLLRRSGKAGCDARHQEPAAEAPSKLARLLPDEEERRRYLWALRRLSMRPVTPARLARHARLEHRIHQVREALRADVRFSRVRDPIGGPERYELRPQYRHVAKLMREALA